MESACVGGRETPRGPGGGRGRLRPAPPIRRREAEAEAPQSRAPRASPADWAGWVGEGAGGEKEGRNQGAHGGERERADPAGRVPGFPRTQMCL